ncbi:MAG: hypothetical protein AAF969_18075, partial [Bacteroidota bacterium]
LLLSFVLLSYSHKLFHKKTDVLVSLIQATDVGMEDSFSSSMRSYESLELPTADELGIRVRVHKSYWGLLEKRQVKANKGKMSFEKIALVGNANPERPALYLKDNQRPLVLVGKTRITGTAHLPERGIKTGNIRGHSYRAPRLIYGDKKRSQKQLPPLDPEVEQQIARLTAPHFEPVGEDLFLKPGMVLKNSFKEPTKILKGTHLQLGQVQLSGNIIVWATEQIIVDASATLRDVILIAPKIDIGDFTEGNFQALASKSIRVGKGCRLAYPSVLLVSEKNKPDFDLEDKAANILIGPNADIRGTVIYKSKSEKAHPYKPHIKIEANATVTGMIHCSDNLELKGNVAGSVTTAGFIALENGSSYQNHLYNGSINSRLLPFEYAGILYQNDPLNQVSQWLY